MSTSKTRVLIIGGGFGGVKAALRLSSSAQCDVTLLSDQDHFRYYPGLYHAATGGTRDGASIPLAELFAGSNVKVLQGTATKLDREHKQVMTKEGDALAFDTAIFALGSITNYFGIEGLPEYSYGIKSMEQVDRFKKHLHEQIATTGKPDDNYIIIGGGPTGIELAGALPGYLRHIMRNHGVTESKLNITVIEALPSLLPRSPKSVGEAVQRRLESLGVSLMLNTPVKKQTADMLTAGEQSMPSHTVVWTAGVANNPFFKDNSFTIGERGKVTVDEFLQAEPGIYVIGDNAGTPNSGLALTAVRDAGFVAHNIERGLAGKAPLPYKAKPSVTVVPVGEHWAVVEMFGHHLTGFAGGVLRSMADLVAFHDIESWPKASGQWLKAMSKSDNGICDVCAKAS